MAPATAGSTSAYDTSGGAGAVPQPPANQPRPGAATASTPTRTAVRTRRRPGPGGEVLGRAGGAGGAGAVLGVGRGGWPRFFRMQVILRRGCETDEWSVTSGQ